MTTGVIVDELEYLNGTGPAPEDLPKGDIAQRLAVINGLMSADQIKPSNGEICQQLDILIAQGHGEKPGSLAARLNNTLTEYESDAVTTIPWYAFYSNGNLEKVVLPNATFAGNCAFQYCSKLAEIRLDGVTQIGTSYNSQTRLTNHPFSNCVNIETISMNSITSGLVPNMFQGYTKLKSISFPKVISLPNYAFQNCAALTDATFPEVTSASATSMFSGCSSLVSASFEKSNTIGQYMFQNCISLKNVNFPLAASVQQYAFSNCRALENISLPNISTIQAACFSGCSNLETLNLHNPTRQAIPTLANVNAFTNTKIAAGTGHIVINDELVSTLKAASNWSTYASQIIGHTDAVQQGIIAA